MTEVLLPNRWIRKADLIEFACRGVWAIRARGNIPAWYVFLAPTREGLLEDASVFHEYLYLGLHPDDRVIES